MMRFRSKSGLKHAGDNPWKIAFADKKGKCNFKNLNPMLIILFIKFKSLTKPPE